MWTAFQTNKSTPPPCNETRKTGSAEGCFKLLNQGKGSLFSTLSAQSNRMYSLRQQDKNESIESSCVLDVAQLQQLGKKVTECQRNMLFFLLTPTLSKHEKPMKHTHVPFGNRLHFPNSLCLLVLALTYCKKAVAAVLLPEFIIVSCTTFSLGH